MKKKDPAMMGKKGPANHWGKSCMKKILFISYYLGGLVIAVEQDINRPILAKVRSDLLMVIVGRRGAYLVKSKAVIVTIF